MNQSESVENIAYMSDDSTITNMGESSESNFTIQGTNEDGNIDLNAIHKLCQEVIEFGEKTEIKEKYSQWRGTAFTPKSTDHALRHILRYFRDFTPTEISCKVIEENMILIMHHSVRRFRTQPQFIYKVKSEQSQSGITKWSVALDLKHMRRRKLTRNISNKKQRDH